MIANLYLSAVAVAFAGAPGCNTAVIKQLAGKAGKARKALAELEARPDTGQAGSLTHASSSIVLPASLPPLTGLCCGACSACLRVICRYACAPCTRLEAPTLAQQSPTCPLSRRPPKHTLPPSVLQATRPPARPPADSPFALCHCPAGFERDDAYLASLEAGADAVAPEGGALADAVDLDDEDEGATWTTDNAAITERNIAMQQVRTEDMGWAGRDLGWRVGRLACLGSILLFGVTL